MSRPPQSASVDASQAELEEEEAISGTGEGDEVMEEVEEQEGYSTYWFHVLLQHSSPISATILSFFACLMSVNPPETFLIKIFYMR